MNQKLPVKVQVLNISLNLSRIGEWIAVDFEGKRPLIDQFYSQTIQYLGEVPFKDLSISLRKTLGRFKAEIKQFRLDKIKSEDRLLVSERLLAWANILQHRASL